MYEYFSIIGISKTMSYIITAGSLILDSITALPVIRSIRYPPKMDG